MFFLAACAEEPRTGFELLEKGRTGLDFRNLLKETEDFNIFKYQYFYNGAGVATADINNDGLEDIFFTGNMVKNRLFLNKGNLKFENITQSSGVAKYEGWCTGVNAIDINNDGWMDFYVCRAGLPFPKLRTNLLFINNKDNTFTESALSYGIADPAHSTHSSFFDYDRDGDLDLFLVNHSTPEYSKGNLEVKKLRQKQDPKNTNKLYRNDQGLYTDVSQESGIIGNVLSFSLGAITVDVNNDDLLDIYVTNDFNEPDYLYVNLGNGQFKESAKQWLQNQSKFSMGVDFADVDNNGYQDILTLDMLPEGNFLQKMHLGADNFDKSALLVQQGFQEQYMRNAFHLNSGQNSFLEVGQFKGVSNTDWSWCPLFFDFDNDSQEDLFISNGYLKDHTDMDFLQYTSNLIIELEGKDADAYSLEEYVSAMPAILEKNYFYQASGDQYKDVSATWKLEEKSVSQGAAYADFDNDGDLDLIVSNSGAYAYLYENKHSGNQWLKVKLKGSALNLHGIGAKVILYLNGEVFTKVVQPSRGFQSSSTYEINFGLDDSANYDSLKVIWPEGQSQLVNGGVSNKTLVIEKENALEYSETNKPSSQMADAITLDFKHNYSSCKDFDYQRLMPTYFSDVGPQMTVVDIDQDGYEDILIFGSENNDACLFYQTSSGGFNKEIILNKGLPISDITVDDLDGNGLLDIVFSVGGYALSKKAKQNKLIVNYQISKRQFEKYEVVLGACNPSQVVISDLDGDNMKEVFCGGTYWQGNFPTASPSVILKYNDSKQLQIETEKSLSGISAAVVVDLDNNGVNELITAGHWSKIKIYNYVNNVLQDATEDFLPDSRSGLWNSLSLVDIDHDQDLDLVVGNMGLNSQLKASEAYPMLMAGKDVDSNGSLDPIIGYQIGDAYYPMASREDLIMQIPMLKKKYLSFSDYAKTSFQDLLEFANKGNEELFEVDTLGSMLLLNNGTSLVEQALPSAFQLFPVFSACLLSRSNAKSEIYLSGNKRNNLVKLGNLEGSFGSILQSEVGDELSLSHKVVSGLQIDGEQRSNQVINLGDKNYLVVCPRGQELQLMLLENNN